MINQVLTSFNRPLNTTAYTAGDCVGAGGADSLLELAKAANNSGGGGYIIGAQLLTDNAATTNGEFRLWLFSDLIIGATDNVAFDLPIGAGAEKSLIGYIDFILETTGQGANKKALKLERNVNMAYKCADTSLYGLLTATAAYTPASGQYFHVKLLVDQF